MSFETAPRAAMDAHVRSDRGSANFGDATRLRAKSDARAYLWFDIDKPEGATMVDAKLELYAVGTGWSGQTATAQKLNQKWSEGKVTWDNKPTAEATTVAGDAAITAALQKVTFDVDALVGTGAAWRGLDVRVTGTADGRGFASSEYAEPQYRPRLRLTWVEDATEPVDLKPNNDNAVATRAPTLTWDWGASNEELTDLQVQLDVDGGTFAAPVYDSGWQGTTEFKFTLPASTLPASGIRDWRVRVRTASGAISPWSDPAGMQYVAMPALTVTAPVSPFASVTPVVTWTFTGQEQAQVFVYDATGKELHKSGFLGALLTYEVPEFVIIRNGTYTFRVKAWDTVTREAVQGFAEYAQTDRVSTFSFTGTVTGVATLTAQQVGREPFVRLTWTRTGDPTEFAIFVDGDKVLDVAGSLRTYDLWQGFVPSVSQTFTVLAGVGTPPALSLTNPTAVLKPSCIGAWLYRASDGGIVEVLNEEAAYAYEDDTEFMQPIAMRYPVTMVGETHAQVASMAGVITTRDDRKLIEEMVRSGEPVRFITGDMNALCQVTDLSVNPGPQGIYDVGFTVTQVGA